MTAPAVNPESMPARLAIVTGGSRGIGRVLVKSLVEAGYDVRFTFRTSEAEARSLEEELPGRCRGSGVDGTDASAVSAFVGSVQAEGPVSLLVNNAGITRDNLVDRVGADEVSSVIDNDLCATVHFCRAVLPQMRRVRYGDIVSISSLASGNVRPGNAMYGASKAALERFGQSLAVECARSNIAVNTVAPGFVETELTAGFLDGPARRDLLSRIPLRRLTTAAEVADAVLMLAARRPLLIGVTLPVGGGAHIVC